MIKLLINMVLTVALGSPLTVCTTSIAKDNGILTTKEDNPSQEHEGIASIAKDNGYLAAKRDYTSQEHEGITFQPWESTNSLPSSGNYYLVNDVVLDGDSYWNAGGSLNFDFNGHSVKAQIYYESGTLNWYDYSDVVHKYYIDPETHRGIVDDTLGDDALTFKGGYITTNMKNVGQVTKTATLNMYGGNIFGNYNANGNTGLTVDYNFNMYGGSILGNSSNGITGIILNKFNAHEGNFAIYGGEIKYNYSSTDSIIKSLFDYNDLKLFSGRITNNTVACAAICSSDFYRARYLSVGGDIYISGNHNLDGTEERNLAHKFILDTLGNPFKAGAHIGLASHSHDSNYRQPEIVMQYLDMYEEYSISTLEGYIKSGYFYSDDDTYQVVVRNGRITLASGIYLHNFTYVADGNTITATCDNPNCPITTGLTLTLKAPSGDMTYNGDPKYATFEEGYNTEAFPEPENKIKYYQGETEVDSCIYSGDYTAKVTFGDATASVNFTIENYKRSDPDSGVVLEVIDKEVIDYLTLRVEVKPTETIEENKADYASIKEKYLQGDDEILYAYDVKLIKSWVDYETFEYYEEEIQPEAIAPGTEVRITMGIPDFLQNRELRVLQIRSADDAGYVEHTKVGNDSLSVTVSRISEFAFVGKKGTAPFGPGGEGSAHGFCIGVILLIIEILTLLAGGLYIVARLNLYKKVLKDEAKRAKIDDYRDKIVANEVLLTFIGACASIGNFILCLIILIVHTCPLTVVSFIFSFLILGGILYWYARTRLLGEMTPIEKKYLGNTFEKINNKIKKGDKKNDK